MNEQTALERAKGLLEIFNGRVKPVEGNFSKVDIAIFKHNDVWLMREGFEMLITALAQPVQLKAELKMSILRFADKAHEAVGYVGSANYAHREQEAHKWVDEAEDKILELLAKQE